MICARCLRRAFTRPFASPSWSTSADIYNSAGNRFMTTSTKRYNANQLSPNAAHTSNIQPPRTPATSTSAAQPFSERDTLSARTAGTPTTPSPPQHSRSLPKSSIPGGTPLKGLNYFKNKEDPIAMEDHEYPDWLWTVLDKKETSVQGKEEMDPRLFAKSARSRRAANKRAKKHAMEHPEEAERQVPIFEQSVDLAPDAGARNELTKGMRDKRRKDIKEANFLRGMR